MKLQVEIKTVYGKDLIYPVCEKSKQLAKLLKTTTLTAEAVNVAKLLNVEFEVVTNKTI